MKQVYQDISGSSEDDGTLWKLPLPNTLPCLFRDTTATTKRREAAELEEVGISTLKTNEKAGGNDEHLCF